MRIDVDTRQAERALKAFQRIPKGMDKNILGSLRESAKSVAARTRVLLRKSRGSSIPGSPPAKQSGALLKAIRFRRVKSRARGPQLAYIVFHTRDTYYGRFLELGTRERFTTHKRGRASRGRIEPRPFLSRANDELRQQSLSRLQAAIEKTLQEASVR